MGIRMFLVLLLLPLWAQPALAQETQPPSTAACLLDSGSGPRREEASTYEQCVAQATQRCRASKSKVRGNFRAALAARESREIQLGADCRPAK